MEEKHNKEAMDCEKKENKSNNFEKKDDQDGHFANDAIVVARKETNKVLDGKQD